MEANEKRRKSAETKEFRIRKDGEDVFFCTANLPYDGQVALLMKSDRSDVFPRCATRDADGRMHEWRSERNPAICVG
jgi:hypothetical protein